MPSGGIIPLLERLPERYLGAPSDEPSMRVRLKAGRAFRDVVVDGAACRIEKCDGLVPDAEIHTDPATWRAIDEGRLSGIEAFIDHRLWVRGSLEQSLRFETLFDRPARGGLRYELRMVNAGGAALSALTAGPRNGDPVLLVHGLGATKASWLTVIPELARRHFVIAVDLPGFGASEVPRGLYDASFFTGFMFELLDALGCESAAVAGNSMGGRVAMEMAMTAPERVTAIACLCPATAFAQRPGLWLAKAARPELGWAISRLPRGRVKAGLKQLFAYPERVDDSWFEAAVDDFVASWRSGATRLAFLRALRNIYLEEPFGDNGFWSRLEAMKSPALYIYGGRDVLITPRFGDAIRRALPQAQVQIWDDCGHVPQIEHPERSVKTILDFLSAPAA